MRTFIDFKEFRRVKQRVEYGENEVVVTLSRPQYDYIAFAIAMLTGEAGAKNTDTIKISGRGVTVFHAVNIAEIVKSHVVGLHQIAEIGTTVVKTEYEPIDRTKNPDNLTVERKVSTILITLSRNQLDKENPGYQEPIPADQVTPQEVSSPGDHRGRGGRRGGRGGRGGARGRRGGSTEVDRRDDRRQS